MVDPGNKALSGNPTIVAIATPPGPGGIGIVRLSGPNAAAIISELFIPIKPLSGPLTSHRFYYGWISDSSTAQKIDEVLVVFMQAPRTYTREDVVEIHCHGNFLILQKILTLCQNCGARLAEPGEFTKLAFLNGRIDLTQAEAVLELLTAKTSKGLQLAVEQLKGGLHQHIQSVCDRLISIKAVLEVAIDFPDDDIDIIQPNSIKKQINQEIAPVLENLISSADNGKVYKDGVSVVIIGRPNVGKSSLLNALLREDRAIVTALPGTTRDTIEEHLNIKGMPVRVIDTAGIRTSTEAVEEIGIQRTRAKLAEADLALMMLDSSGPISREDLQLFESIGDKPLIVVANKFDISTTTLLTDLEAHFSGHEIVRTSATNNQGISQLEDAVFSMVTGHFAGWDPGHAVAPNARHQAAMTNSLSACHRLVEGLEHNLPPDLLAIELQTALDHLGDIVGYTTTEEILDKIFGEFCIGK
nr:tRNA uridine-5-carboxymethylaminomethyl(34) synthesis GTPase MnmE [Desulfobulbaceae bacterium]